MLQWHSSFQYWWLWQYTWVIWRVEEWTDEETIWKFIDKTFWIICKLMKDQWFFYSEYKKYHDFKYQNIVCSNSLIKFIADLYKGKMNDHQIVRVLQMQKDVHYICCDHSQLFLYSDQIYQQLWDIMKLY